MNRTLPPHVWPMLVLGLTPACGGIDKGITVHNTAPVVRIDLPEEGAHFLESEEVSFVAVVQDTESQPEQIELEWSSDLDGLLDGATGPTEAGEGLLQTSDLSEGIHSITVKATDPGGKTGEDTMTVTIETDCLPETECDFDQDGFTELEGDCDDGDADRHPDMEETLNAIDDDCDGTVDEGTDGFDDDGDGFTEIDGDCDDDEPEALPGGLEVADGIDNNCDGTIDEETDAFDDDGDGYSETTGDCDDTNILIHPDAEEVPNGVDDDCDGFIDEGTDLFDDDGDGYTEEELDCDDTDGTVHPGATEICDEIDNDCDGVTDEEGAEGEVLYYEDFDEDGYGGEGVLACSPPSGAVEIGGDCDDTRGDISPDEPELCDGVDNNCDGDTDEDDAVGCTVYFLDADRDGYGHETDSMCMCEPESVGGYNTENNEDCCDIDYATKPGAAWNGGETDCGGYDFNCDGIDSLRWPDLGTCSTRPTGECVICGSCAGWEDEIPGCGESANKLISCADCIPRFELRFQHCR